MNRKRFVQSLFPLVALGNIAVQFGSDYYKKTKITLPPFLKPGDTIAITSPAGYVTIEEIMPCVQQLKTLGFTVLIGNTIGKKHFSFGGTDDERLQDLQTHLNNNTIQAIFCARGGYGCVRIIDAINWDNFKKNPKWIIGFSDITVLHSHVHNQCKIASIHGKMCSQFPENWNDADVEQKETLLSIFNCLTGKPNNFEIASNKQNTAGVATGILLGGNLKIIESLTGSSSDVDTKGKILFVEDVGEALYSIDRMFYNLDRSKKLSNLAGLIIGGFAFRAENANTTFGENVHEIVTKHTKQYNYPICFDFPVGHQKNNYALICGGTYQLSVTEQISQLQYLL